MAVHPHAGVVVTGTDVQQHALARPLGGHLHAAPVPDAEMKIRIADPRKAALRAKGHDNLAGWTRTSAVEPFAGGQTTFDPADARVKGKGPGAIQVQPVGAHQLRPRILWTRCAHCRTNLSLFL